MLPDRRALWQEYDFEVLRFLNEQDERGCPSDCDTADCACRVLLSAWLVSARLRGRDDVMREAAAGEPASRQDRAAEQAQRLEDTDA